MDNTHLIEIISSKKAEYKEAERLNLITKAESLLVEINYLEELLNCRKCSIPLDKVKKAREDIIATHDSTLAIVEILDKLIAESEGK